MARLLRKTQRAPGPDTPRVHLEWIEAYSGETQEYGNKLVNETSFLLSPWLQVSGEVYYLRENFDFTGLSEQPY